MTSNTTEYTRHEELRSFFSDMYKDAYGFRPRNYNTASWTEEELMEELDELEKVIAENEAEEKAWEKKNLLKFETAVANTINMGAGNRKTALTWMMDAWETSDLMYGAEQVMYDLGVWDMELKKELNPIIGKILNSRK